MRKVLKESHPKCTAHKPVKITTEIEKKIVEIASKNPREGYGLLISQHGRYEFLQDMYPRR